MTSFKYILESYRGVNSRYSCPQCGYKHKFTRYIDTATNEYLAEHVGRCDRENSCGYHYKPKQYFEQNNEKKETAVKWKRSVPAPVKSKAIDFLPFELLDKSMDRYQKSNLYPFLLRLFSENVANWICENYFIGANKIGDTVFWQVDVTGKIRQTKFMRYNSDTGRRNKEFGARFAGKLILGENANLQQCYFGEYLLSFSENSDKPIAIVESEKTACIAFVYFPNIVWLATGGKTGCKWTEKEVCNVLEGRKIILFPDLGAYENWTEKAKLLSRVTGHKVVVSDVLERGATEIERKDGLDIADYLLKKQDSSGLALTEDGYPVIFDFNY